MTDFVVTYIGEDDEHHYIPVPVSKEIDAYRIALVFAHDGKKSIRLYKLLASEIKPIPNMSFEELDDN